MLKRETEQAADIQDAVRGDAGAEEAFVAEDRHGGGFHAICELAENKYCEDNGRPSCAPVVLFKRALIQYLFGIWAL